MNSDKLYPIEGFTNTLLLKPLIAQSDVRNVEVGEFSYYSDFEDPTKFLENNVLYNFGFSGTSLRIGKYSAIAHGTKFIMADANHATQGVTTFPFAVFGGKWAEAKPLTDYPFKQYKDIVVGNDVWLGFEVTVMPGVTIGNGAIIGAKSVVASDVPAYAVAAGNPAKVIRQRFTDTEIEKLEVMRWWDWPQEHIEKAIPMLVEGGVETVWDYAVSHSLVSA
ncbi:Streptogramin A acetyltransferase [Grimontia celer]|uniref:Streptogramin A acetyltransferase n=1 Tax=Grimontia celer TaxID=1796497 RepID=A0A128FA72_9GAMM|nr:CatB-related O-acetyltransferase [Grimontia celer]CZF83254.1 Streptogramin A acetyltransferase [Grimontia celer]